MISSCEGFSFLEVLIALSLLSIGLLGVSTSQLKSVQYAKAAYLKNIAINQFEEVVWEKRYHLPVSENSLLPHMYYQVNGSNMQLIWQSPIVEWHCTTPPIRKLSCLQ